MNNSEEYETFVKVLAKDNVSKVFMNNDGENMITVITEMLNHSTSMALFADRLTQIL